MDKFKVGQYVVFKDNPCLIHKVVRVVNDNQVELEYPNCGCASHRIVGVTLIRRALNIDYMHTWNADVMAKWKVSDNCWMCSNFPRCLNTYKCDKYISKWLQKPYDGWVVEQ